MPGRPKLLTAGRKAGAGDGNKVAARSSTLFVCCLQTTRPPHARENCHHGFDAKHAHPAALKQAMQRAAHRAALLPTRRPEGAKAQQFNCLRKSHRCGYAMPCVSDSIPA